MLDHLGEMEMGAIVLAAIEETLESGIKTGDIGGSSNTAEVTDAIIASIQKHAK